MSERTIYARFHLAGAASKPHVLAWLKEQLEVITTRTVVFAGLLDASEVAEARGCYETGSSVSEV